MPTIARDRLMIRSLGKCLLRYGRARPTAGTTPERQSAGNIDSAAIVSQFAGRGFFEQFRPTPLLESPWNLFHGFPSSEPVQYTAPTSSKPTRSEQRPSVETPANPPAPPP